MDWLGIAVPGVMVVVAASGLVKAVARQLRIQRAWRSGLTAEGSCLRAWTTSTSNSNGTTTVTHHHLYEFTPRGDHRPVRFEEENGPVTVVQGDYVTVHYPADRPDRATAVPRGVRTLLGTVGTAFLMLVVMAFALWFGWMWLHHS